MAAKYDDAIADLERAVELYREQKDEEATQRAAGRLAEAHYRRGTVPEAVDPLAALAEARGDPVTTAAHRICLGGALHLQGDWEDAHRSFQRADALAASADPSSIAVRMAAIRAPCLIWDGEWEQARHYLDRTLQLARMMRLEPTERIALSLLAQLDVLEGQPAAAVARLAPLVDAGVTWHVAVLLPTTLASAYLLLDEVPKAVPLADRAVAEARGLGVWPVGVDALRIRALVAIRQGDADQARSALHEGLQHARSIPFPYAEARLLEASALLDREEGDDTSAHASLEEALALYARLGAQRDVTRLRSAPIP